MKLIIESLSQVITKKVVGELKSFPRLHMICNRSKRTIWLLQRVYIMKICNEFALTNSLQQLAMQLEVPELFPINEDEILSNSSMILYQ